MLDTLPIGVVVFPGSGISANLADKAKKLGIPVWRLYRKRAPLRRRFPLGSPDTGRRRPGAACPYSDPPPLLCSFPHRPPRVGSGPSPPPDRTAIKAHWRTLAIHACTTSY
jgi:hypothetical protein